MEKRASIGNSLSGKLVQRVIQCNHCDSKNALIFHERNPETKEPTGKTAKCCNKCWNAGVTLVFK